MRMVGDEKEWPRKYQLGEDFIQDAPLLIGEHNQGQTTFIQSPFLLLGVSYTMGLESQIFKLHDRLSLVVAQFLIRPFAYLTR